MVKKVHRSTYLELDKLEKIKFRTRKEVSVDGKRGGMAAIGS